MSRAMQCEHALIGSRIIGSSEGHNSKAITYRLSMPCQYAICGDYTQQAASGNVPVHEDRIPTVHHAPHLSDPASVPAV